jgi:hypothetical protein
MDDERRDELREELRERNKRRAYNCSRCAATGMTYKHTIVANPRVRCLAKSKVLS